MPASSDITVADVRVALPHKVALHARPAADFVRTAMGFSAEVWVSTSTGEREVDAKSLLSLLALGAQAGTTLRIRAEGADAAAAVDALAAAVARFRE